MGRAGGFGTKACACSQQDVRGNFCPSRCALRQTGELSQTVLESPARRWVPQPSGNHRCAPRSKGLGDGNNPNDRGNQQPSPYVPSSFPF